MEFSRISEALAKKGYDLKGRFIPYAMDVCDYLRRHDVVFNSPIKNGADGLFVGNGDFAAMSWTADDAINIQINKNDLWVYPDEEDCMLLRAAGQLKLDFGMPVFRQLFLDKCESRMRLADGTVVFESETAFAKTKTEIFADADKNVLFIRVSGSVAEPVTLRLSMERYGSRGYRDWSHSVNSDTECCLGKARSYADGKMISMFEPFDESGKVSCAMSAVCADCDAAASKVNSRRAELSAEVDGDYVCTFAVSVASSFNGEPESLCRELLACADYSDARSRTNEYWRDFWNRSFVHYKKIGEEAELDYLENLYYIQNYVMAVSSRGMFPAPFNGGLCVWNHDIRQWVNPHHWNTQQAYWALEEANRPELMKPYLRTYFDIMPSARKAAKEIFNSDRGIAVFEMHDFEGRMLAYHNTPTVACQIAIHFWNHYLYNKDEEYLRTVAYPFIAGCAELYADYAKKDETTGKYNIGPVMPMESAAYDNLYNTSVDGSMTRYILPAAIKAASILGVDADRVAVWQDLLDNIFDFTFIRDYSPECALGDMLATGVLPDMKTVICESHGFARSESPVMPSGIVGLRDRGTRIFEAMKYSTARIAASALAITPASSIWARLGEGERAISSLYDAVDSLQHFSQGLFFNLDGNHGLSRTVQNEKLSYKPNELALPFYQRDYIYDERSAYKNVVVRDREYNELRRADVPTQVFAQCGLETPGILTHAFQELALQSFEGVIRIFPSFGEGYRGVFTLKAAGGFMVTGAIGEAGVVPFAIVKSLFGTECVIDAPFEGLEIFTDAGEAVSFTKDDEGFVHFGTAADVTYILKGCDLEEADIPSVKFEKKVNDNKKTFRCATIGSSYIY